MAYVVTPLGTFLEGTEHEASQELEEAAKAEIASFRNEVVTKVAELEKEVEGK